MCVKACQEQRLQEVTGLRWCTVAAHAPEQSVRQDITRWPWYINMHIFLYVSLCWVCLPVWSSWRFKSVCYTISLTCEWCGLMHTDSVLFPRWASIPVPLLWQSIQQERRPEDAHSHTHSSKFSPFLIVISGHLFYILHSATNCYSTVY